MHIRLESISYIYGRGVPHQEVQALQALSLAFFSGELTAVLGATGSGKTTLVQIAGMLLKPTQGKVYVDGTEVYAQKGSGWVGDMRKKLGYLFQNPYHQIIENTVFEDVAFGPRTRGLSRRDVFRTAQNALETVGIDVQEMGNRSPYLLSGGQLKRVALAGVIALQPEMLILDEPLAGLDPGGRKELVDCFRALKEKKSTGMIVVTHALENILPLADRVIVLEGGKLAFEGSTDEFLYWEGIYKCSLQLPPIPRLLRRLKEQEKPVNSGILTPEEAAQEILNKTKRRPACSKRL